MEPSHYKQDSNKNCRLPNALIHPPTPKTVPPRETIHNEEEYAQNRDFNLAAINVKNLDP